MSQSTQFLQKAGATPPPADTLPADITDIVFRRIIILCLLTVGMAVLGTSLCIGSLFIDGSLLHVGGFNSFEIGKDLLMILVSLAIAWVVHRRLLPPRALIVLGLGFGVFASMWHAVGETFTLVTEDFTPVAYFSFTQAWVVFFPAIVPVRMRRSWIWILLAASTAPLSRGVAQSLGLVELPSDSQAILTILMAFSTIMGLTVSHVVYRLGRSVKAAREMGSYTLGESLGKGGMGEVWRASHRMLARPAAVKLIKPEILGAMQAGEIERLHRRFEQEVQATAALCSPHTVDIYDYGLARTGAFYYVMELLDGIDMETLVSRFGPVEPERAVHFLIQACHSLGEAHGRQLIHRDIKPANLFVCTYGDDHDFVKVLDFGLVKQERTRAEDEPQLTVDGAMAGTPAYMFPEAVSGKATIDARSDIYSLGCVAYWLLTGRRLFSAETPMAMLVAHATMEPEAPSLSSELAIPAELDRVILACLAKNPDDRPRNAAELARRLRGVEFDRPWGQERARDWWELHGSR